MQAFFDSYKTCARRQREFLEVNMEPIHGYFGPRRFQPASAIPEENRVVGLQYMQYTKTCTTLDGKGKTETAYFHLGVGAMAGWDAAINDCKFKTKNTLNHMEVAQGQCLYSAKIVRWKEYLVPLTNGAEPEV